MDWGLILNWGFVIALATATITLAVPVLLAALGEIVTERAGVLNLGLDGVMVAGCGEGDCEFRFGMQITAERLAGAREPHLRASVPRERLEVRWLHRDQAALLASSLAAFRQSLAASCNRDGARPRRLSASAANTMEKQANVTR